MNLQGDLYEEDEYDKIEAVDADNDNLSTLVETRKDDIALERLKRLYVKLWLSLRATVRVAFQTYTDVLEAGTFIQNTMDRHMKGRNTSGNRSSEGSSGGMDLGLDSADPYLRDLAMSETERLQVLDFYNTFSEYRDRDRDSDHSNSLFLASCSGAHGLYEFSRGGGQHRRCRRDGWRVLDVHTCVCARYTA